MSEAPAEPPAAEPPAAESPAPPAEIPWQRLDAKMLLLNPIKVARSFLVPAVITTIGLSTSQGPGVPFLMIPVFVLGSVLLGAIPWLTTRFRLTDSRFEQRSGLVNKKRLTAPLDRIRSVDLESSLLHRVLGLAKVQIGTGVDESRIELDSLSVRQAEELRAVLLARRTASVPAATGAGEPAADHPVDPSDPAALAAPEPIPAETLAAIDWRWLRFAPLNLTRLAVVAGALGALSQFADDLPVFTEQNAERAYDAALAVALPLLVLGILVVVLVSWSVISLAGYVVQWWGFALVREQGHLRLTTGLLTTRSVTVEESKVRGAELSETLLMRLAGGAELSTLATGVGAGGVTSMLPPCPTPVAIDVGHRITGDPTALTTPLTAHGPIARRRCHVRAQWLTVFLTVATTTLVVVLRGLDDAPHPPLWVPVVVAVVFAAFGVLTAEQSYRHLGHGLTGQHLVAGSGSWQRVRTALERDGVIGWVVSQSVFQRRVGLATLVATTAAGAERVVVRDVALAQATDLAHAATPGLFDDVRTGD